MDDPNRLYSLVNTRGRVIWVHEWDLDAKLMEGCRRITNPKETWYPAYDQTLNANIQNTDNIVENIEVTDILKVEEV